MHVSRAILEGIFSLELECGRNGELKRELAAECPSLVLGIAHLQFQIAKKAEMRTWIWRKIKHEQEARDAINL